MKPPRLARLLAALLMPPSYRDEHLGDLSEGFHRLLPDVRAARRWYRRQALASILPALRMRGRALRDSDPTLLMRSLRQDLLYGLRSLARSRMFSVVAVLTLALAIGVNTSIFSLVNVIVFADLPMQEVETATVLRTRNPALEVEQGGISLPDFLDVSERARSFEALTALADDQWVLTGADVPTRVGGYRITANLMEAWGLQPLAGRGFAAGDDRPGAAPVAMLSQGFWQSQFGGDPAILGSTLRLDGVEHTIVGVMDPRIGFAEFALAQVWAPLPLERTGGRRDARDLFVVGRLRPGVTQAQATEEVAGISRALQAEHPETNAGWAVGSSPVRDALLDSEAKIVLLMLVLTVAFVMLIACANVANMLLARATVRQRELAVRAALGAQRGRLIRQLLTESLVLSLVAAALGIGIAFGLNRALVAISRGVEAIFRMATIDTRVLLFTVGVALVAPALFGLLPALKASRSDLTSGLRDGRSGGGGRANRRARGVLVSAQVALALCLMVVAGLLARTVYNSETRVQGFERQGLVAMELDLPADRYGNGEPQRIFYREALTRVAAIPTVQGAALSTVVPGVDAGSRRGMEIEGRTLGPDDPRPPVLTVTVSEGAFDVLRIPLERGRGFETRDHGQAPPVAVLSAEVARRWWPEGDALGQRIRFGTDANSPWLTIVGIVGDVLGPNAEEAVAAYVYLPFEQHPTATARVLARSDEPPAALADPLRAAVWSVDADQPVDRIRSVATAQYERAASSYALITLFVAFALFALAMAALGIYGVMSYMVSQRRAEIGLRMALGAEAGAVHRMILAQGGRLLAGGLVVGLALALMLSRLLRSVVYGISATDPATFLAVPTVLVLVAVAANWVPAWRATRSDPVSALREE